MIEKIFILLLSIFFSVAFAMRNAYQRQEVGQYNAKASKGWHLWEVIIKICFALVVAIPVDGWFHKIFAGMMVAAVDFLIFPLLLNIRTSQRWDYLSDNGMDKQLKKIPSSVLLLIKLILLIIFTLYFFYNPFS